MKTRQRQFLVAGIEDAQRIRKGGKSIAEVGILSFNSAAMRNFLNKSPEQIRREVRETLAAC